MPPWGRSSWMMTMWADSMGSRGQRAPQVEGHHWLQFYLQELLGSVNSWQWQTACWSTTENPLIRWFETTHIILTQNKVKEVLKKFHEGSLGRHLGAATPWKRLDSSITGHMQRVMLRGGANSVTPHRTSRSPNLESQGPIHQLNGSALFKKIVTGWRPTTTV
jgi:hypothetical protein